MKENKKQIDSKLTTVISFVVMFAAFKIYYIAVLGKLRLSNGDRVETTADSLLQWNQKTETVRRYNQYFSVDPDEKNCCLLEWSH